MRQACMMLAAADSIKPDSAVRAEPATSSGQVRFAYRSTHGVL